MKLFTGCIALELRCQVPLLHFSMRLSNTSNAVGLYTRPLDSCYVSRRGSQLKIFVGIPKKRIQTNILTRRVLMCMDCV